MIENVLKHAGRGSFQWYTAEAGNNGGVAHGGGCGYSGTGNGWGVDSYNREGQGQGSTLHSGTSSYTSHVESIGEGKGDGYGYGYTRPHGAGSSDGQW